MDEHFAAIVKEVMTEMGGRLWRNREAACSALADLVQVQMHHTPVQSHGIGCLHECLFYISLSQHLHAFL